MCFLVKDDMKANWITSVHENIPYFTFFETFKEAVSPCPLPSAPHDTAPA